MEEVREEVGYRVTPATQELHNILKMLLLDKAIHWSASLLIKKEKYEGKQLGAKYKKLPNNNNIFSLIDLYTKYMYQSNTFSSKNICR